MHVVASNAPQENLEMAFSIAENHLGVTRLLDPEGEFRSVSVSSCRSARVSQLVSVSQLVQSVSVTQLVGWMIRHYDPVSESNLIEESVSPRSEVN